MVANLQRIPLFPALYGACGGLVASYFVGSSEGAKSVSHLTDGHYYYKLAICVSTALFLMSVKNGYKAGEKRQIGDTYTIKKTDVVALSVLGSVSSWLGSFYGLGDCSSKAFRKAFKVSALGARTTVGVAFLCYSGWIIGLTVGRQKVFDHFG